MIRSLIRTLAFTSNWTALVVRQPSIILWMIAGPFAVLLLFGIGATSVVPPPTTIVVTRGEAAEYRTPLSPLESLPEQLSGYLNVVEVTDDLKRAMAQLRARRVRLVVVVPENPADTIRSGRRAIIEAYSNEIDPTMSAFIRIDIRAQMAALNNGVEERAVSVAKQRAEEVAGQLSEAQLALTRAGISQQSITQAREAIAQIENVPTDILVAPFDAEVNNIAPLEPTIINFFTPAAIAVVIQHLAVTLAGLSMVRARLLGVTELWRTAPVRLGEIIAGNYLTYGILTLATSGALVFAVTWALGVPVLGPMPLFWLGIVLLVFASLGLGFAISLVATNEQIAAQMAMIVFLSTLFLGGFVQPLDLITFPVNVVSYLLPATYGVQILQDVMVRGEQGDPLYFAALGVLALVGLIGTVILFRRELRPT